MNDTPAVENSAARETRPVNDVGEAAFSDRLGRQLWPLDVETLCAKARQMAGLDDFGGASVEQGLSVLVDSLNHEANLHPLGRFLMRTHLLDLLKTRLQLIDAWKKQSETVNASPITRPIFITGMPRSGSTFLHELLAADPRFAGASDLGSHVSRHCRRTGPGPARPAGLESRDLSLVVSPSRAGSRRRLSHARPDAARMRDDPQLHTDVGRIYLELSCPLIRSLPALVKHGPDLPMAEALSATPPTASTRQALDLEGPRPRL